MASCSGCKKRTTSFCYVHKSSICDDCSTLKSTPASSLKSSLTPAVAALPCDSICSIGNYFDWLADGDYTWPPRCNICNLTLQNDPSSLIRLVCKDIFHKGCLGDQLSRAVNASTDKAAAWKQVKCPTCSALLVDTTTQARTKLREQVQEFVSQLSKGESFSSPSPPSASTSTSTTATPSKSSANSSLNSSSSLAPSSVSKRKEKEDDDFVIVNNSNSNLRKTEISPAVRDLMNKAASAKAAAPAGTAPSAVSLNIPPTPSPTLDAQTRSPLVSSSSSVASSSVGAVSRPTSHAASNSSAASSVSSSYSGASSSSNDLESQRLADDDDNSKTKKPSRFMSLRNASKGGFRCSPQRIIIIIMLLAVLLSVGFYIKSFAIMASNPPRASAAPQVNSD